MLCRSSQFLKHFNCAPNLLYRAQLLSPSPASSSPSQFQLLRTMSTQHYDALVLGSGQSGTPLASHLKSLGLSTCLIERSHIGGCCINEGCTPTKTMVASGRVAYIARKASDYGVHFGEDVKVDIKKVRERKRAIVESFRGGSERRIEAAGVDVLSGEGAFVGEKEVNVRLSDGSGEKKVSADKIFINVGCRPSRPKIPGLDDV